MNETLNRLCDLAASMYNAPIAAICLFAADSVKVLGSHGIAWTELNASVGRFERGYSADAVICIPDLLAHPGFRDNPIVTDMPQLRALLRAPVSLLNDDGPIVLVVGFKTAIEAPVAEQLALLAQVGAMAHEAIAIGRNAAALRVIVEVGMEEICAAINKSKRPALLLDADLHYLHVNKALADGNGVSIKDHVGRSMLELAGPAAPAMAAIFKTSLRENREMAELEFIGSRQPGAVSTFSVSCQPIKVKGRSDPVLRVTVDDITQFSQQEQKLRGLSEGAVNQSGMVLDPTARFLDETLISRQTVRSRKALSYITLRAWRKPIKAFQIDALKALKAMPPEAFVAAAADEIREAVLRLLGAAPLACVVPIPCGASGVPDCLSVRLAHVVAERLGKPCIEAFEPNFRPGVSHPKENLKRPPLKLKPGVTLPGPCLLLDDVATSGAHLEEGSALLRTLNEGVFALAWIGGDASDDT
ncbi:MAG: PAS domain S-box protein [Bosea sp. (in: a-proteobacteria)]